MLKQAYTLLVQELKKAIKYLNENGSVGMSIKDVTKGKITPEIRALNDTIDQYRNQIDRLTSAGKSANSQEVKALDKATGMAVRERDALLRKIR